MSAPAGEAVFVYLRNLSSQQFWGAVTLKYEGGDIVHIRKEENLKPSSLSELPRVTNAKSSH